MKIKIFYLTMFICLSFSCKKTVDSNEYVTLKFGETVIVPNSNGTMKISFKEITDGRCPRELAHLCYPNLASITISLIQNEQTTDITLTIGGENGLKNPDYCVALGYRFGLSSLLPHPDDVTQIKKDDYVTKIKITQL